MDCVPSDSGLVSYLQEKLNLNMIIFIRVSNEDIISHAVATSVDTSDIPLKLAHADFEFSSIRESLESQTCHIYEVEVAISEPVDSQISQIIENYLDVVIY